MCNYHSFSMEHDYFPKIKNCITHVFLFVFSKRASRASQTRHLCINIIIPTQMCQKGRGVRGLPESRLITMCCTLLNSHGMIHMYIRPSFLPLLYYMHVIHEKATSAGLTEPAPPPSPPPPPVSPTHRSRMYYVVSIFNTSYMYPRWLSIFLHLRPVSQI